MRQVSLRLHQLARALDERFKPYVHKKGLDERPEERERQVRSRALAAMAANMVSGISHLEAARRVTDCYHDDGIDGFAVKKTDPEPPTIYLVQAKWSAAGNYHFSEQDATKLFDGLAKLRPRAEKLHKDNLLREHLEELRRAKEEPGARFMLVWATTGRDKPSPGVTDVIAAKVRELADDEIVVEPRFLLLDDFVRGLEAEVARTGVSVSGGLLRSHKIDEQHESLQGTISAAVLGRWYREHTTRLFDDNVRLAMTVSEVNREIVRCLQSEPEHFWYFNNGVTALCEKWVRSPATDREISFRFDGLRIVNGAQTVSSIDAAMTEPDKVARAQVPIRFIKLEHMGPEFGARITYATNRANPMQPRDLLAMDHVQQRLRDEFRLTWGLTYAIRVNDPVPAVDEGCSVLEAVIAMATGRHDVGTLVTAKRTEIASLWPDNRELYGQLFNDDTSVVEVWCRVQALRLIMSKLQEESACTTEREKAVAVLGDLVIAHVVFRWLRDNGISEITSDWEDGLLKIARYSRAALRALVARVNARLAARGASGTGFKQVSALLEKQKWLTEQVTLILADSDPERQAQESAPTVPWSAEPEFWLDVRDAKDARGGRCDGGFLVYAGSTAADKEQGSLTTPHLRHRRNLRDSLGLVPEHGYLRLTRDALFESSSQAAAVLQGHSVNGPDQWATKDGVSYNEIVKKERTTS